MTLRKLTRSLVVPVVALGVGFGIAAVAILLSHGSPSASLGAMFSSAFGSATAIGETLVKTIPLVLTGLAVALGLRAGLFNIGAEGQLLIGALCAAWVGYAVELPGIVHVPLCLAAGVVGGALWALLPGLLRAKRGVHEVITTIMLNYTAFYLTHYLVTVHMQDASTMAPQTPAMHESARLGVIMESSGLHWGVAVAVLAVIGFGVLISRSVFGYELKAVGLSPDAARTAGIEVRRTLVRSMLMSGALAGIAGAVEVMGIHHKFYDQFSPGYGFDSIAVAFLGNSTAVGTALSALLFGALKNGALGMQLVTDTPKEIVILIQSIVIIFAGLRFLRPDHTPTPTQAQDNV